LDDGKKDVDAEGGVDCEFYFGAIGLVVGYFKCLFVCAVEIGVYECVLAGVVFLESLG
jgi:hypothetical protein